MIGVEPSSSKYLPITEFYRYGDSAVVRIYDVSGTQRIRVLRPNTTRFITDNTLWSVLKFDDEYLAVLDADQFAVRVKELRGSLEDVYPKIE